MNRIREVLSSPKVFKIVSVLFCVWLAIGTLNSTGSYASLFMSVVAFYAIWALGYCSRSFQDSRE